MNYSGISECDVLNGTGFRTVLFVSGCNHHCTHCHNSETWDVNFGHLYTEKTEEYLMNCLSKDYIDGITITGGDPLHENNLEGVLNLINKFRILFPSKNIWLYSGFTWEKVMNSENSIRKEIISKCDVFIDGRYEEEKRDVTLQWRGSSNQRVIDIKKSLEKNKVELFCEGYEQRRVKQ